MLRLAVANLTHRKVRSALSVVAVAIAITLLLVLVGLSRGTLNEVSGRLQSVQAEVVVSDKHFDLASYSGGKLWEKEIPRLQKLQIESQFAIQRVIPVFLSRMKLAGLSQNVFGVHPNDFLYFTGSRRLIAGEIFYDIESPAQALREYDNAAEGDHRPVISLPLIIDERLSKAAKLKVGDSADFGDTPAQIVGVVETGVAGRVFAPINRLRAVNGIAAPTAHMFFVKANPALNTEQLQQLCETIEIETKRSATLVANYHQVLAENFHNLTIFITLVSIIALVICFLFILVTMYTIVLERSREMAILQSLGASRGRILAQTIQESLLICTAGTILGCVLAYGVRHLIETIQPLMTVEIHVYWLLIAAGVGLLGGILSAVYPGYVAYRHDPIEALSFE
jgi:putative ABC transport system permease protein